MMKVKWIFEAPICGRYEKELEIGREEELEKLAMRLEEELRGVPERLGIDVDQWRKGIKWRWEKVGD